MECLNALPQCTCKDCQPITVANFTPEMVFTNMLRLWKAEDMKAFYDMLSRRPECYAEPGTFLLAEHSKMNTILGSLFSGCGNHGCKVQEPKGMASYGPCRCADRVRIFKDDYQKVYKDAKGS